MKNHRKMSAAICLVLFLATAPSLASAAEMTIGLIGDIHSAPEEVLTFPRLKSAISKFKSKRVDFSVDLGDLVESRFPNFDRKSKKEALEDLNDIKKVYASAPKTYNVLGNHDLLSMTKKDFRRATGMKSNYYSFDKGGYRFIVLDTQFVNVAGKDIIPSTPFGQHWGAVPTKELDWLESKLNTSKDVVIFSHHPLYSVKNKKVVLGLLKDNKKKIVGVFSGHTHDKKSRTIDGIKHFVIPSLRFDRKDSIAIVNLKGDTANVEYLTP